MLEKCIVVGNPLEIEIGRGSGSYRSAAPWTHTWQRYKQSLRGWR